MVPPSSWLTGVRLRRLGAAVLALPKRPDRWPADDVLPLLYRRCGGPTDEIQSLVEILCWLGLADCRGDYISLSAAGGRIARALQRGDQTELALALVRSGCFHDQASKLIEVGALTEEGELSCQPRVARSVAAQLLGVLTWWPAVQVRPLVQVPKPLLDELNTIWALLPPPIETPSWLTERKRVGDRAEMYTVQFERTRVRDSTQIRWVARDADDLGWDVEDHSTRPMRRIEVKGRRDGNVTFYLSANEWARAHEFGEDYELHFWGEIDLNRDPAQEYAVLRAAGYPLSVPNLAARLSEPEWASEPTNWKISRSAGLEP